MKRIFALLMVCLVMLAMTAVTASVAFADQPNPDPSKHVGPNKCQGPLADRPASC